MARLALKSSIQMLQGNRTNGARELATCAVSCLKDILFEIIENPTHGADLWLTLRRDAWKLGCARPSMQSAILSALVEALTQLRECWDKIYPSGSWPDPLGPKDATLLVDAGVRSLQLTIGKRTQSVHALASNFITWLSSEGKHRQQPLKILTLSYSSSLMACMIAAFHKIPAMEVDLRIMESRPRCEGAVFAATLLDSISAGNANDRWSISVSTDSSVAMLSRDIDVVLLGADCISSSGDVSNKMGCLAAVICAKALSSVCKIVVVAECDKIKPGILDMGAEEENEPEELSKIWDMRTPGTKSSFNDIHVRNVYFEWVPGRLIDLYITDVGKFDKEDVKKTATSKQEKENNIFDSASKECL